jgi:hypothetical protein
LPACAPSSVDALMADPQMHYHTHQMIHHCSTSFASLGAEAATQQKLLSLVNKKSYTFLFLNLKEQIA